MSDLAPEPAGPRRSWFRVLQVLSVGAVVLLLALLAWRLIDRGRGSKLVSAIASAEKPLAPSFELPVIWPRAETWPAELRPALADGRVALRELRGRPVVLNFWASWCVPCKEEAPRLAASARAHAGEVAFLGLDVQDFKSDARRFLRRYRANYVSVRDGGAGTYGDYGLTGLPETYYLDREGRIVAHSLGEISRQELEDGIALASEEAPE